MGDCVYGKSLDVQLLLWVLIAGVITIATRRWGWSWQEVLVIGAGKAPGQSWGNWFRRHRRAGKSACRRLGI